MKRLISLVALLLHGIALAQLPAPGQPGAPNDPRYCGEPERDASGRIKRSGRVLREFAKVFPCPATLLPVTSCEGWAIDHVLPLVAGGCHSPINLQWLPLQIKTCSNDWCKDRFERTYHSLPRRIVEIKE